MTEYCVEGYGEQGIELAVVVGLLLVLNGRGGREFERFGNSRSFGSFGRQAASPFCLKQEGAFGRGSSVIGGEDSQRLVLCPLSLTLSLSHLTLSVSASLTLALALGAIGSCKGAIHHV